MRIKGDIKYETILSIYLIRVKCDGIYGSYFDITFDVRQM